MNILKSENIRNLFNELKKSSPPEVSRISLIILESFIFLEKTEQKDIAESIYKWSVQHAKNKPVLFCYAKLILAFSYYYREEYDSALPLLIEAQNLFADQNDLNGAAVCLLLQGSTYRTFGNVDLALKALWAGHDQLSKAENFLHFLLASNVTIGGIFIEMKHFEDAMPLFKESLEKSLNSEKFYWTIYSLHGLGKIYLAQEKTVEAKECFEQAIVTAEKYNHTLSFCNSLSELGNYYFAIADYPKAEQYHHRSLEIREQNQFIGGAITNCIRLGEIYLKESSPEKAIRILEKGLKLSGQIKVKPKMYQIHLLLSGIYQNNNELEKSLFHYKMFHELREQVEVEDSKRKIKNVQIIFEAEQTKKENVIIKKQKEEIERKNSELQETIDELTRARIGKKARAITLVIAIILFIVQDFILHFALSIVPGNNYFISLIVKMVIIFSLSPINKAVEAHLFRRIVKKKVKEI